MNESASSSATDRDAPAAPLPPVQAYKDTGVRIPLLSGDYGRCAACGGAIDGPRLVHPFAGVAFHDRLRCPKATDG